MNIVTVITRFGAGRRYYQRKRKCDLRHSIKVLCELTGVEPPDSAVLDAEEKEDLITRVLNLHAQLPEDEG